MRRRRTQLGEYLVASPTITTLVDKTGAPLEWPTDGYDIPTVEMALFVDAMLIVAFMVTSVFIYHWSREDTASPASLHGARDAKFQKQANDELHASLPPPQEEACAS